MFKLSFVDICDTIFAVHQQVVHNYGHAGHGITLGWGCGRHAARLVKEAAQSLKARL